MHNIRQKNGGEPMLMKIPEGTVILKENEVNMDMYKIVQGCVEVYSNYGTNRESILGIMSKGAYFGEVGLLAQKPSVYTVVAYSDLLVQRITMNDIDEYILHNHHDVLAIMQHMAESLYNTKYSMDMVLDDLDNNNNSVAKEYRAFVTKQFAKYNVNSHFPVSKLPPIRI